MFFFLERGYRVIAHDRRGHGRSTQTVNGNDMDTYASDGHELVQALGIKNAIDIGHSTGGGEATRYVARYGKGLGRKLILISAVPPVMLKSEKNPGGVPIEAFDEIRKGTAKHRAQYYQDLTLSFTVTIERPRRCPRAYVTTGGARRWKAASSRNSTASRRSPRRTLPRTSSRLRCRLS